jgi:dethiobiotin synthetase
MESIVLSEPETGDILMKKYFITASGTGIGKTLVTSTLAWQLHKKGKKIKALKPVVSGFDAVKVAATDTGRLLQAQGLSFSEQHINAVSPWRFTAPVSPDQAAEEEGKHIDFDELVVFSRQQSDGDYLLVEGIGGVMTPLDESHTVIDWMAALGHPVILVGGNYVGSLSHTLSAAHVVLSRGLTLHAVFINEAHASPATPQRTRATLRRFLPRDTTVNVITRQAPTPELWKHVPDLTSIVL